MKAGREECKSLKLGKLTKDLELDEHNLFSVYVGLNNESDEFKEALDRAKKKKHGNSHPYFLLYVRVIAFRERAGRTCLALLPHYLVPPKSRPPCHFYSRIAGLQDFGQSREGLHCPWGWCASLSHGFERLPKFEARAMQPYPI